MQTISQFCIFCTFQQQNWLQCVRSYLGPIGQVISINFWEKVMSLSLGLILAFIIAAAVMIKHEMSKKSNPETKKS